MMKRVMFLILSLAVLIGMGLATSAATAKEGTFGDMRWRWESFKNFEDLTSDDDDTWTAQYLRARLGYEGRIGETGFYKMSVENMRVMGGDYPSPFYSNSAIDKDISFGPWPYLVASPLGTTNSEIFVNEAYFGTEDFLFKDFTLKFGRFNLNYGRERIIGSNDWSNHAVNRFDGIVGQIGFESGWIDLMWLDLVESGPEFASIIGFGNYGDATLRGAYGHFDAADGFYLEPHVLWFNANNKNVDEEANELDDANVYGFGTLLDYTSSFGLHIYGEIEFQTGSFQPAAEVSQDISSLGFYGGAFYTFDSEIEPYIGVEYNYASGDDDFTDDEFKYFLNPFGSNTEYLGRMNMVGWGMNLTEFDMFQSDLTPLGVSAIRFAGGLSPNKDFDLAANLFLFHTQKDYTFGEGETGSKIGTELDVELNYYYTDNMSIEAGMGLFSLDKDYLDTTESLDSIWYNWLGTRIAF